MLCDFYYSADRRVESAVLFPYDELITWLLSIFIDFQVHWAHHNQAVKSLNIFV